MTFGNRFAQLSRAALFIAAALAVLIAGAKIVRAFNPQPDPPGVWGMFGITPSETARLNVVNLTLQGLPAASCSVQVTFLTGDGTILKRQVFAIKPAQSAFLDLTGAEAGGGFRTELHPFVQLANGTTTGCSAVATLELFDTASGKTSLLANPIFVPASVAQ